MANFAPPPMPDFEDKKRFPWKVFGIITLAVVIIAWSFFIGLLLGSETGGIRESATLPEVEDVDDGDVGADPGIGPIDKKAPKPPGEQVMTTRRRRKANIPFDLLDDKSSTSKPGDIERNKEIIRKTLDQFGIDVEMYGGKFHFMPLGPVNRQGNSLK